MIYLKKSSSKLHRVPTYDPTAAEPLMFAYKVCKFAYKVCKVAYKVCKVACYVIIYRRRVTVFSNMLENSKVSSHLPMVDKVG